MLHKLQGTVSEAIAIIKNSDNESLARRRMVQGFNYNGLMIIFHVVEHYAYHAGQIIFWTKLLKNKDLGFYKEIDLNNKNEK